MREEGWPELLPNNLGTFGSVCWLKGRVVAWHALSGAQPRFILIHPAAAGPDAEAILRKNTHSFDLGVFQLV